jgi:hypothetical protein
MLNIGSLLEVCDAGAFQKGLPTGSLGYCRSGAALQHVRSGAHFDASTFNSADSSGAIDRECREETSGSLVH